MSHIVSNIIVCGCFLFTNLFSSCYSKKLLYRALHTWCNVHRQYYEASRKLHRDCKTPELPDSELRLRYGDKNASDSDSDDENSENNFMDLTSTAQKRKRGPIAKPVVVPVAKKVSPKKDKVAAVKHESAKINDAKKSAVPAVTRSNSVAAPAASVDDFTSRMASFDEQVRKQTEQMQLRESDIKQKQQLAVLCDRYEKMLATANKKEISLKSAALKLSGNPPIVSNKAAVVTSTEVN